MATYLLTLWALLEPEFEVVCILQQVVGSSCRLLNELCDLYDVKLLLTQAAVGWLSLMLVRVHLLQVDVWHWLGAHWGYQLGAFSTPFAELGLLGQLNLVLLHLKLLLEGILTVGTKINAAFIDLARWREKLELVDGTRIEAEVPLAEPLRHLVLQVGLALCNGRRVVCRGWRGV